MGLEIIGAGLNYKASKKASKAQQEGAAAASAVASDTADKQLALQREIWEKQQADYKPYLKQGTWGINRLGDLMRNQTPAYNSSSGFNATIPMGMGGVAIIGDGGTRKPTPNANGGQLNNPFDTYLKSKGVANKFDSSNTRLDGLMKQGSGQLNNPFDSYLASKGVSNKFDSSNTRLDSLMKSGSGQLNNPFDSYLASKGLAGGKFDTSNPAYQFQLKQGQQALDRSSAARGMGYSGAQMKASQEYGQGLASQQYDKEYNRASGEFGNYYRMAGNEYDRANQQHTNEYNRASGEFSDYYRMAGNEYDRANQQNTNEYNRASGEFGDYFNRLAGLSQGGQQAAGSMANAGSQYANSASNTLGSLGGYLQNNLGQAANARASGYIGKANAINGGIQNITDNAFRLASLFNPLGG